jgi:hypothetical protein
MSSDDLAGDDSDLDECVCGEVGCLYRRAPGTVKNPYAALPKRVSKTPGGIKQPPKKKPAAPKSRKSRQKASVVITVRKRKGVSSHARDFKFAVRDYTTQPIYMKALDATTDENRLLHQEEQAKQLGLILHTEEVLRSPQQPVSSI